ncbi:MAG: helix-turn-helix transcriptional regulator [Clostridia bacterium]|nr:helix-turn-helix transcriptional regulator [Clostridia bacterium]
MNMGDRIRILRTSLGMTQEELGKIIGVQKSAIRKYESGAIENIKRSSIKLLAETFNVTPSYLMCFDEKAEQQSLSSFNINSLDDSTMHICKLYQQLNQDGKNKLLDYMEDLLSVEKYKKNNSSFSGSNQEAKLA